MIFLKTCHKGKYTLLIPAMLDAHFPILKYAFYSREYHPVILENEDKITDVGLQYVNNDMCYPSVLNTGQMIAALKSAGAYNHQDVNRSENVKEQRIRKNNEKGKKWIFHRFIRIQTR